MIQRFGQVLGGVIVTLLVSLNTVLICIPLFAIALARLLPWPAWQRLCRLSLVVLAETWIDINSIVLRRILGVRVETQSFDALRPDVSYLVCCNHQSWSDIPILQYVFNHRIPFLRFFLKQQLIYVPFLGLAWWALDFPFMRRYSPETLAKHPELRTQDMETTRRACERFRDAPVTLINFLEGTRLTAAKYQAQKSPYRNLLKPKTGGLAYAIEAMGDQVHGLLDVTIVYPDGAGSGWDFVCGRVPRVVVRAEERAIPGHLLGEGYHEDEARRAAFQEWVAQMWRAKDSTIDQMRQAALATESRPTRQGISA